MNQNQNKSKHTPASQRLAEILLPEGIDSKGRPSRLATAYGPKTREGLADLIDNETAAPQLLAVAGESLEMLAGSPSPEAIETVRAMLSAAISKAEGHA